MALEIFSPACLSTLFTLELPTHRQDRADPSLLSRSSFHKGLSTRPGVLGLISNPTTGDATRGLSLGEANQKDPVSFENDGKLLPKDGKCQAVSQRSCAHPALGLMAALQGRVLTASGRSCRGFISFYSPAATALVEPSKGSWSLGHRHSDAQSPGCKSGEREEHPAPGAGCSCPRVEGAGPAGGKQMSHLILRAKGAAPASCRAWKKALPLN